MAIDVPVSKVSPTVRKLARACLSALFALGLGSALATTRCTADLADGNPCYAVQESFCNLLSRCNLFPFTGCAVAGVDGGGYQSLSDCLSNHPSGCSFGGSASGARSCASDLDSQSCSNPTVPTSCAGGIEEGGLGDQGGGVEGGTSGSDGGVESEGESNTQVFPFQCAQLRAAGGGGSSSSSSSSLLTGASGGDAGHHTSSAHSGHRRPRRRRPAKGSASRLPQPS